MTGNQLLIVVTRAQKKKSLVSLMVRVPPTEQDRAGWAEVATAAEEESLVQTKANHGRKGNLRMVKMERVQLEVNAPLEEGGEEEEVEEEHKEDQAPTGNQRSLLTVTSDLF